MTAKEKALDLVTRFTWQREEHEKYVAKEIAKTCVEEILNEPAVSCNLFRLKYWQSVKQEIEKL